MLVFLGKRRRKEGNFCGSKVILDQLRSGSVKKRVGLTSNGPVLRQHCNIVDENGDSIGHVTSGCPSPTLNCNIAMAYVPKQIGTLGSEVHVAVRNKMVAAKITKMPFVSCSYYHKK